MHLRRCRRPGARWRGICDLLLWQERPSHFPALALLPGLVAGLQLLQAQWHLESCPWILHFGHWTGPCFVCFGLSFCTFGVGSGHCFALPASDLAHSYNCICHFISVPISDDIRVAYLHRLNTMAASGSLDDNVVVAFASSATAGRRLTPMVHQMAYSLFSAPISLIRHERHAAMSILLSLALTGTGVPVVPCRPLTSLLHPSTFQTVGLQPRERHIILTWMLPFVPGWRQCHGVRTVSRIYYCKFPSWHLPQDPALGLA